MPNTLITPDWITKQAARILVNNLKFAGNVNRDYDDQYVQGGAKVGFTVKARLPQRFVVTRGQALQQQSVNDSYVPITLTDQTNVAFGFSTASMTMEVDDVQSRYVEPAGVALANDVDLQGLTRLYPDIYQSVGTPGVTATSNLTYLQAGAKITLSGGPMKGRVGMLDPISAVTLANANVAVFNPQGQISDIFREGQFGAKALMVDDWYQDQNVASFTTGSFTSATPLTDGANQTGSSLITNGWASGATTLQRGDVFTIAGVYAVNQVSFASTGQLQQFSVQQTISDTSGAITMTISPPIITSGQFQTVTASPADDAAITMIGSAGGTYAYTATASKQSLVYHPDAFVLVMADLMKPSQGAVSSTVRAKGLGIAVRMVTQYNIQTDQEPSRFDLLYGWATLRPVLACRVYGG